jgi:hypothetical protein
MSHDTRFPPIRVQPLYMDSTDHFRVRVFEQLDALKKKTSVLHASLASVL